MNTETESSAEPPTWLSMRSLKSRYSPVFFDPQVLRLRFCETVQAHFCAVYTTLVVDADNRVIYQVIYGTGAKLPSQFSHLLITLPPRFTAYMFRRGFALITRLRPATRNPSGNNRDRRRRVEPLKFESLHFGVP